VRDPDIIVVGGGLAGSEACWQIVRAGRSVRLYEMKPKKFSPAHRSEFLAELVCSNSLRSTSVLNASGLLKEEMRRLGSLIMEAADATALPAGGALAVDRVRFSMEITRRLEEAGVDIVREEVTTLPSQRPLILCTGPLPSEALAGEIRRLTGEDSLYFYDAISPIVDGDSIDHSAGFWASRYGKGGDDYLNLPLDEKTYYAFVAELVRGRKVPLHAFENIPPFEGCLPIEDLAARGKDTLAHGPMKPVGLVDPRTGKQPFAVVQLRRDSASASLFNIVGFQTKLVWPEQDRIFRMIPGLERARFHRYGSLHKNAYVNAPRLLAPTLQFKKGETALFFAGQMTGVEGYVESAATGLLAGVNAARLLEGRAPVTVPATTALGALVRYITHADPDHFQPMNVNFGLLDPPSDRGHAARGPRRSELAERALEEIEAWKRRYTIRGADTLEGDALA
jgi:methylenetetrahydrofolate--tRNA-(uracil-5-)-methyltransferase